MSAIGAEENSDSLYARSKAAGEAAVFGSVPRAIVLRPSIQFGPEDQFFNRFAAMARFSPALPLVGASTRFQPVFVGDVAEMVARSVDGAVTGGRVYELGGPEVKTFRELMRYMLAVTGRRRLIIEPPAALTAIAAQVLEMLPGALLTTDQVRLLQHDNVVSEAAVAEHRTLAGSGVTPTPLDAVVPTYLWRFRKAGQFETLKAR